MEFSINLAGRVIAVHSIYDRVQRLCLAYLSDSSVGPDLSVNVDEAGITAEAQSAEADEGKTVFSRPYLEQLAVYRQICEGLLAYDTYLMHGSVVATDPDHAYMLTARSGVGKTTRTRLWLEAIPGSFVVNGDKPLLKVEKDRVLACGTPWCGKEGMNSNCMVPLRAVFLLERADENEESTCTELSLAEAFPVLFTQTYRPADPQRMKQTLQLIQRLEGKVRFFRLRSDRSTEAVRMAYAAVGDYQKKERNSQA